MALECDGWKYGHVLICCPYHGYRQAGASHAEAVRMAAQHFDVPVIERRPSCRSNSRKGTS